MVSGSRKIFGFSILVALFFFLLNSIQSLLGNPNLSGFVFMMIILIAGYTIARVVILKESFIPNSVKMRLKKLG